MARFPIPMHPTHPYSGTGAEARAFGTGRRSRRGRRLHAGCDLYAPIGTPILAIAEGTVILPAYNFYEGTDAIEVFHPGIGVVRYGEVLKEKDYATHQAAVRREHTKHGITGNQNAAGQLRPPVLRAGQAVTEGMLLACVGKLTIPRFPYSMVHFELYDEAARGQNLSGGGLYMRNRHLVNPTNLLLRLEQSTFNRTGSGSTPGPDTSQRPAAPQPEAARGAPPVPPPRPASLNSQQAATLSSARAVRDDAHLPRPPGRFSIFDWFA